MTPTEALARALPFECPMCGGVGRVYNITEAVQAAVDAGAVELRPIEQAAEAADREAADGRGSGVGSVLDLTENPSATVAPLDVERLAAAARRYRLAVSTWQRHHNKGEFLDGTKEAADELDAAYAEALRGSDGA